MSDYSPPYTDEDAKLERRRNYVHDRLMKLNVSKLSVGQLFAILEAYEHGYLDANEHDVSAMESILTRLS